MKTDELHYDLPADRIAARPLDQRSASRMLLLRRDGVDEDRAFVELPELLETGDLLVVNDTRVIPARLLARKPSGGQVELLLTDPVDDRCWWTLAKGVRRLRVGSELWLQTARARVEEIADDGRVRVCLDDDVLAVAEREGHVPLPPYIARPDDAADRYRYQTVFAKQPGAVAAPTAALHFDDGVLARLDARGVQVARLTLHVGPGTFQPVRVDDLSDHRMGAERYHIGDAVARAVASTRAAGRRVVAVGTTSTRALESAADGQRGVRAGSGRTELFITPGYRFQVVDALLTNFHLPGSTLIALVMALAGQQRILSAYRHAVDTGYRFYSYGDCMLIL
ncbi:MAG: tRNA preQ1(34) S-adenosylmethionine ribosyltransferase-isomerase QueA [Pseudomonadota bacterium]